VPTDFAKRQEVMYFPFEPWDLLIEPTGRRSTYLGYELSFPESKLTQTTMSASQSGKNR
jgi:hypothetical protein